MANDTSRITRITPSSWFKENAPTILFKVPVYQRLFTWGKSQFDRLLSDLMEWKNNDAKPQQPYYLGIITVVKNEKGQLLLIDGQQRLTVVAILAGMFGWSIDLDDPVNFLDYEARPDDRESLKIIWKNGATWFTKTRTELESKLSAISSDSMREFVLHIFDNKGNWQSLKDAISSSLTLLVSYLPDNYSKDLELQNEYFEKMNSAGRQLEPHEILKVQICKKEDDFKTWNLVEDFTRSFDPNGYVASDVSEEVYFESIIDAEVQEIDKKKTIVMTPNNAKVQVPLVGDENQRTSIEKWRPSLIDFPMFLLHVLKLCKKDNADTDITDAAKKNNDFQIPGDSHNLLSIFRSNSFGERSSNKGNGDINSDNVNSFVEKMRAYRLFLDKWIIHKNMDYNNYSSDSQGVSEEEEDDSSFSYWNGNQESERLHLDQSENESVSDILLKKIKQVQMALYAIGGQSQKWLCETFSEFFSDDIKIGNVEKLYSILVGKLIELSDFRSAQSQLKDEWPNEFALYNNGASPAKFVCLDYFLWLLANSESDSDKDLKSKVFGGNSIPQAVVRFIPRANRSVEHFHPQTDNNNSSCHIGLTEDGCESPGWGTNIKDTNVSIKDIFGNLALISAGRNSEYRNYSVNEKSRRIDNQVEKKSLESIKLWLMSKLCQGDDKYWTPALAQAHANMMAEVIRWGLKLHSVTQKSQ